MGDILADPSLTIENSRDFELIKSIIFNDEISPTLLCGSNQERLMQGLENDDTTYYIFRCNNVISGIACFVNFTKFSEKPNLFFSDIAILKNYRGKIGVSLAQMAIDKIILGNNVFSIMTIVKIDNLGCINFCKKLGFKIIERNGDYFLLEATYGRRV